MKFKLTPFKALQRRRAPAGFTLAEVLAALLLMAIVIPVAIQGVRVASLAGVVGHRKIIAVRLCERIMNELLVTGQTQQNSQSGTVAEGVQEYHWDMRIEAWEVGSGTLRQMTVQVSFPVQGRDYEVHLSTLVDTMSQ
jgi:prepilin-type N-terminal cleavage/methylation domain-containing protein